MGIGIGLWLDMRNPPAWRRSWPEHYARTLERVAEAERLGLGAVWLAEHHLFEDGYLPQPLTFAAAIAARTTTIRIGTSILQAPLRKAIDIAEQGAIVDILSNGRLELGLGAGYAAREFEAYGVEQSARHRLLRHNAREVMRLWEEGVVTPPPVQSPRPLWIGALGPQLSRFAGTIGAGLLTADLDNIDS
jgi:alkanesulfonate monooxygenase SsuD/methylene tetrahydromethanopterin reductase-like flavin-dependent oxidoreductase (luciferase family)